MLVLLRILGQLSIRSMETMIKKLLGIFNLRLIRLEINYKEKSKIRYRKVSSSNLIWLLMTVLGSSLILLVRFSVKRKALMKWRNWSQRLWLFSLVTLRILLINRNGLFLEQINFQFSLRRNSKVRKKRLLTIQ